MNRPHSGSCVFARGSYDETQIVFWERYMDQVVPADSIPIKKEDLFFALVRLYLLIDDIDPGGDEDTTINDVDFHSLMGIDNGDDDEGPEEDGPDDDPCHFQDLLSSKDESLMEYAEKTAGIYIGLFALLSTPLEEDPLLKKEFREYALLEHGVEIEFSTFDKKPKLTIVHSKKDDPTSPAPDKPLAT